MRFGQTDEHLRYLKRMEWHDCFFVEGVRCCCVIRDIYTDSRVMFNLECQKSARRRVVDDAGN